MKKLLVISTAVAMLSLSGAAYGPTNSSTQVQVATFLPRRRMFKLALRTVRPRFKNSPLLALRVMPRVGLSTVALKSRLAPSAAARPPSRSALNPRSLNL